MTALRGVQLLQWAYDFAEDVGGDLRIERRRFEFLVPEQHLDQSDVDFLFEQVGGEGMAQGVHRDMFLDAGFIGGGMDGAVELSCAEVPDRILAGEQPAAVEHLALRPGNAPPDTQPLKQYRRQQEGVQNFV